MTTVTIEQVNGYGADEVGKGLANLLEPLGGMAAFVRPGERVLLKPNLLAARQPEAAVTTHPELVRGVIRFVQQAGGIPLVGDSPGIGTMRSVAERSGILQVVEETGAELVAFNEPVVVTGSGLFKRFDLARPYLEADRLINLPKLKTHEMMTMTCAVKNLFGAVVGADKAAWHLKAGADRELFARMLIELYLLRKPDLTIVDAITAMEGNGPGSGDPRHVGLLLAGDNPLAVDGVAADILGIPRHLLPVERVAVKLGLEGAERTMVQTRGVPLTAARVKDFRLPHISDLQFGLPAFIKRPLRNLMTSRPHQRPGACHFCGICRDACPPGAIKLEKGRLTIDYAACIRCFCCRELCPHDGLAVRDGSLLRLLKVVTRKS